MKVNHKNYTVIPARCTHSNELFGIRGIYRSSQWHLTWAFRMTEHQAKIEHIENNTINGSAVFDSSYPGCPHCGNQTYVLCGACKHMTCSAPITENTFFKCSWCGNSGNVVISDDISGVKSGSF